MIDDDVERRGHESHRLCVQALSILKSLGIDVEYGETAPGPDLIGKHAIVEIKRKKNPRHNPKGHPPGGLWQEGVDTHKFKLYAKYPEHKTWYVVKYDDGSIYAAKIADIRPMSDVRERIGMVYWPLDVMERYTSLSEVCTRIAMSKCQ